MKKKIEKVENKLMNAETIQDLYFIITEKNRISREQEEKKKRKKSILQRVFPYFFREEKRKKSKEK